MPARRLRTEEEGKRKREKGARRFNPIRIVDINSYPLEGVTEGASAHDEKIETDTPVENTEDEDFDEGEEQHYKEQAFEAVRAGSKTPRARLAFVICNGKMGVAVQGVGQPISPDIRRLIIQKALTLKTIGQVIIDNYPDLASPGGGGRVVQGWLVQSKVAEELKKRLELKEETLRAQISKVINTEWAELPGGDLVPLRQFFRATSGPSADAEAPAMLEFFSNNPNLGPKSLAETYLAGRGHQPGQKALVEKYRKTFERLIRNKLRDLAEQSPEGPSRELAEQYLASRGLKADGALTSAVANIIDHFRGDGHGR